jgi:hypothetical protein
MSAMILTGMTPEHDESEPGTPHDSGEERTVDGEETILHGAE